MHPKGSQPAARKSFGMIRFTKYIVIHGGKDDERSPFTLNTIHFLDLKMLEWKNINDEGHIYRYGHNLINYMDNEIVIFGGKNDEGLSKQIYPLSVTEEKN